jgi:hypothetical protein
MKKLVAQLFVEFLPVLLRVFAQMTDRPHFPCFAGSQQFRFLKAFLSSDGYAFQLTSSRSRAVSSSELVAE